MKPTAALLIVAALVVAAVPQFTDCLSQGLTLQLANGATAPMKCHWSALAMIALGVPLAGVGALLALSKRRESQRNLGLVATLLGVFIILTPTSLIGVCANPAHLCNAVMLPTLILSGGIVAALGLGTTIYALRRPEVA
jgi:hypothetical protein